MNIQKIKRNNLIMELLDNPYNFINILYTQKSKLFSRYVEIYSPYIKINDNGLICLINNSCTNGITSSKIMSTEERQIYYVESLDSVLQVMRINDLGSFIDNKPYVSISSLVSYEEQMNKCLFKDVKSEKLYIVSDEYTNNVLISYFLSYIYEGIPLEAGMKGVLFMHDTTIYNSTDQILGINLYENVISLNNFLYDERSFYIYQNVDYNDFGERTTRMRVLSRNFILDLFKQLLINLMLLQTKYSFIHGNLKSGVIAIKKERVDIKYLTLRHTSDITFKITDFRHASMTINVDKQHGNDNNTLRLFNSNSYAKKYHYLFPFKPIIEQSLGESYYLLDNILNVQLLNEIRHLGIEFYSSFDTVTLILSLLLKPTIFYSIISDPILKSAIWDNLWHPKDASLIYNELFKLHDTDIINEYDTVLSLLKGKWLKCNLTKILMDALVGLNF